MSIIEEAMRLVHGARQDSYGHPYDDFSRTGRMWGAILDLPEPVPPHLVALCMVAVKVSREVNAHKRDNLVDIAGYSEALGLVREAEASRARTRAGDGLRSSSSSSQSSSSTSRARVTDETVTPLVCRECGDV